MKQTQLFFVETHKVKKRDYTTPAEEIWTLHKEEILTKYAKVLWFQENIMSMGKTGHKLSGSKILLNVLTLPTLIVLVLLFPTTTARTSFE